MFGEMKIFHRRRRRGFPLFRGARARPTSVESFMGENPSGKLFLRIAPSVAVIFPGKYPGAGQFHINSFERSLPLE